MKLFVFYPDTYIRRCGDTVLLIGLHNGEYLLEKESAVAVGEDSPWFEITKDCMADVDMYVHKGLGYMLDCDIVPFIPQKRLHVISSIHRTSELMKFNEGYYVKDLLREVRILTHNTTYQAPSNVVYAQMEYPNWGDTTDLPIRFLTGLANNPIQSVVISGDVDNYMSSCLEPFVLNGKLITIRTYGTYLNIDRAMALLFEFPCIRLEILVDSTAVLTYVEKKSMEGVLDRMTMVFLVEEKDEIDAFSHCFYKSKTFIPILYDTSSQQSMVEEMLLGMNDIVKSSKNIMEIYKKQLFHPQNYGSLLIDSNGDVFDSLLCIGNIYKTDIYELLNECLHASNCSWYMTRRKWNGCNNCVFVDVCPALSIYEMQGIIPRACNKLNC